NAFGEIAPHHYRRGFLFLLLLPATLGFGGFGRLLVVGTDEEHAILQGFLQQVRAAAIRTLLRHRLVRRGELALRVIRAAVEDVSAPRLLLHQLAIRALRTFHADEVLFHPLALGIAAA